MYTSYALYVLYMPMNGLVFLIYPPIYAPCPLCETLSVLYSEMGGMRRYLEKPSYPIYLYILHILDTWFWDIPPTLV